MIFSAKTAKLNYCTFEKFLDGLCSEKIHLELAYESDYVNNQPTISFWLNDIKVYSELCNPSGHVSLTLPIKEKQNVIKITMSGKQPGDTLVDDGSIIKDTYVKFAKLHINKYSLLDDYDFFYEKFVHLKDDGTFDQAKIGLWSNSSLVLKFLMPFDIWYNTVSKKNCAVSDTLKHQEADNIDTLITTLEESVMKLK